MNKLFFFFPAVFQDVQVMIFVGFGFLMTFLKKYGYSAVGYNFFISALAIQWYMIIRACIGHHGGELKILINMERFVLDEYNNFQR